MITSVCKKIKQSHLRLGSSLISNTNTRGLNTSCPLFSVPGSNKLKRSDHYFQDIHQTNEVFHPSGAIKEIPPWYKLGILKLIVTFGAFLMVGAQISKYGTKFLEENDIFKPEEDDDEDDDEYN